MHIAPLLQALLLASTVPVWQARGAAEPTSSLPPLELLCEVGGSMYSVAGVDGETVLINAPDGPHHAPPAARWSLRGLVRDHAPLLHGSPYYNLERDARHDDGRQHVRVYLEHRIDVAPPLNTIKDFALRQWAQTLSRSDDPFVRYWNADPSKPGLIVAAWLLGGEAAHVEMRPIPQVGPDREFVLEFEFSLAPADSGGQPVLLLWQDGAWVRTTPFSDHPPTEAAWRAVMFNDTAALDEAIRTGARLGTRKTPDGITLAHYAAESGATAALERLLADRPRSALDRIAGDESPLTSAASKGRTEAVSALITFHTRKDEHVRLVSDAFVRAVSSGHAACARVLLPWVKDADPRGPFWEQARLLPWTQGYVDLCALVEQPTPPVPPPDEPSSRVYRQPREGSSLIIEHVRRGRLPMVRHLLTAHKHTPNVLHRGETPLVIAAANCDEAMVRELLGAGANPNFAAAGGVTALMAASRADATGVAEVLLAHGAKPNATNAEGMTALHFAAERDALAVVSLLLDAGADLQVCNIKDVTPLDLALFAGAQASAQILISRGACIGLGAPYSQDLILASISNDIEGPIATAIEQGWPATSTFSGTWPALRVAELLGATRSAGILRAAGASSDPDLPFPVVDSSDLDAPLKMAVGPEPIDPRRPDEAFPATSTRVRVLVDPQGHALFATTHDRGDPRVMRAALKAAHNVRFAPPQRQGGPVAAFAAVDIHFAASRDRVFPVSEADEPPPVARGARPYYPRSVKSDRNARVIVAYVLNAYGRVEQVEILESTGKAYSDSVRLALSQWSFRPATHRGTPIAIRMTHTFTFDPEGD